MFCFDIPQDAALHTYCDSFACHTADMGVEFSMPHFETPCVHDLLPDWHTRSQLRVDVEILQDSIPEGPFATGSADDLCLDVFLKSALPIYGLQHTTNNLNEDVHKALSYWPCFWEQLKNFEGLLLNPGRLRRFRNSCVHGSVMADKAHMVTRWTAQLYEKRWKCVVAFLRRLASIMQIFRVCWDEEAYRDADDNLRSSTGSRVAEDDDGGPLGQFDPSALTKSIKDNFFNRYIHFAIGVDDICETHLASWGEGCLCHEMLFRHGSSGDGMSQYRRRQLLACHFTDSVTVCPMAGKRAPELAAGRIYTVRIHMALAQECNIHTAEGVGKC